MTTNEMEKRIADLEIQNAEQQAEIERLNEIINNFQRRHFKSSSEKTGAILQLNLFNEAETIEEMNPESPDEEILIQEHKRRKKGSGIKESAVRIETIDHPCEDKSCPECGTEMKETDPTVIEKLVYKPAEWILEKHIIHNYICPECSDAEGNPKKAESYEMPQLVQGSLVTPSVFAHIVVEKFLKSVPLYRLESNLFREGVFLSRQTMSNWFLSVIEL